MDWWGSLMAEGNWRNWEAAAVPQQSGGEGFAPEHSSLCSLLLLLAWQPPQAAGGGMGVHGAAHPLLDPTGVPWGPCTCPACLSPVHCCPQECPCPQPFCWSLPLSLLMTDGKNAGSSLRTLLVLGDRSLRGLKLPLIPCPLAAQLQHPMAWWVRRLQGARRCHAASLAPSLSPLPAQGVQRQPEASPPHHCLCRAASRPRAALPPCTGSHGRASFSPARCPQRDPAVPRGHGDRASTGRGGCGGSSPGRAALSLPFPFPSPAQQPRGAALVALLTPGCLAQLQGCLGWGRLCFLLISQTNSPDHLPTA